MSTRHAQPEAPISAERYMSSSEYVAMRGVHCGAVTEKARLLANPRKRSLLFFLQSLSLEEGGMRAVAEQLLKMFPDHIGSPTMRKLGLQAGKLYSEEHAKQIATELGLIDDDEDYRALAGLARGVEPKPMERRVDYYFEFCRDVEAMALHLMELCINPRVLVNETSEGEGEKERDRAAFIAEYRHLQPTEFRQGGCRTFKDVVGALYKLQRHHTEQGSASVAKTTAARKVVQTLDACLASGRMVLIEGESDAGKSTSAEAWCQMHRGEARFVRLQGVTNKTVFFRAIARALGVASSYMRTAKEMQARVEDMLQRSKLVLVLDESQYCFAQSERIYSRPELVDWIYTACVNHGVPVALIASPLFSARLHQAERQTIWNSDQFRRRIYRYEILPAKPTSKDIELVVRHQLPSESAELVKYVAAYAATETHPFTAIADAIADARQISTSAGRDSLALADIKEAVKSFRTSSEMAKRQRFDEPRKAGKRKAVSMPLEAGFSPVETGLNAEATSEDTFTGRRPVAALETPTARSGMAPAFQDA